MLNNIIDKLKLPFRKDKELFLSLYEIIGFYPHDIAYYKLALMHKSVAKRNEKGKPVNNERLEFLGDAILDAIVGDIVYRHFEGKREGFLTNTRSKIVQRDTLNKLANEMGINNLILSSGHSSSHNSYMGGNAFEALVGAIYLDRGYEACMVFMKKRILAQLINIDKVAYKEVNFKSKLIEWSQKNRVKLEFRMCEQKNDEKGSPIFNYQVMIEGLDGGKGKGYSKKESQQLASKLALERLRREPQFIDEVFAAKGDRTKMEEEPVENVPDTEVNNDFLIPQGEPEINQNAKKPAAFKSKEKARYKKEKLNPATENNGADDAAEHSEKSAVKTLPENDEEFDLSDITATPEDKSKEDIIAAAEAAAFTENA
jgi:ribonuclease-3